MSERINCNIAEEMLAIIAAIWLGRLHVIDESLHYRSNAPSDGVVQAISVAAATEVYRRAWIADHPRPTDGDGRACEVWGRACFKASLTCEGAVQAFLQPTPNSEPDEGIHGLYGVDKPPHAWDEALRALEGAMGDLLGGDGDDGIDDEEEGQHYE